MNAQIHVGCAENHYGAVDRVLKHVRLASPHDLLVVSHETGRSFTLQGGMVFDARGVPLYVLHGAEGRTAISTFKQNLNEHVIWLRHG